MTKFEREMLGGKKKDKYTHQRKGETALQRLERHHKKAGMGGDRWKRKERTLGIR